MFIDPQSRSFVHQRPSAKSHNLRVDQQDLLHRAQQKLLKEWGNNKKRDFFGTKFLLSRNVEGPGKGGGVKQRADLKGINEN